MAKKKSWREKLRDTKDLPKVVKLSENALKHWQANTMAIPKVTKKGVNALVEHYKEKLLTI